MNTFDILMLVLPGVFFLLGYVRGAWREFFSLAGATAGAILGAKYLHIPAASIATVIADKDFAALLSFLAIFLVGYLLGGVVGGIVEQQTRSHAPSGSERLLAAIFGACKGLVLNLSIIWLVGKFLPAFQTTLRQSGMADQLGGVLKILGKQSPF